MVHIFKYPYKIVLILIHTSEYNQCCIIVVNFEIRECSCRVKKSSIVIVVLAVCCIKTLEVGIDQNLGKISS